MTSGCICKLVQSKRAGYLRYTVVVDCLKLPDMIDLHIKKSPILTIIEILVLYWGSKRVIVSLKRNDPKSRPHTVPANTSWQYFS